MVTYAQWVAGGSPYRDACPVADLAATLRGHGYTVWTKGNDEHMRAQPPEDHTPYSATGWPVVSAYPVGHALDIAEPGPRSGLPTLRELGAQIFSDVTAGVRGTEWIKYMNWTPSASGGPVHDAWQPVHTRSLSSDSGHIHISARSDMDRATVAAGYDPVARLRGDDLDAQQNQMLTATTRREQALATGVTPYDRDWTAQQGDTEDHWLIKQINEILGALRDIYVKLDDLTARADASGVYAASGTLTLDRLAESSPVSTAGVAPEGDRGDEHP